MAISTNQKPTIYRNLYEKTAQGSKYRTHFQRLASVLSCIQIVQGYIKIQILKTRTLN